MVLEVDDLLRFRRALSPAFERTMTWIYTPDTRLAIQWCTMALHVSSSHQRQWET